MATTEYIDRVTHIEADWANDVDALTYDIFEGAQTKREARLALGIDNSNVDITGGKINNTTIGLDEQATGWFNWIKINELPIDPLHGTNKRYVDSLFQSAISGSNLLEQDVPIIGTSVGAKDEGYVFPLGMTFTEFVIAISTRVLAPSYAAPTLNIGGSPGPTTYEIGTVLGSVVINSSFSQNDSGGLAAGTPGSYRFYINNVLTPGATPQNAPTLSSVLIGNTPVAYKMDVSFTTGPVKNNNVGTPDPTGRILAGIVESNTLTYVGARKTFFGTPASTPTNSAGIRALTNSNFVTTNNPDVDSAGVSLVPAPNPSFIITIPIGATRVMFAYPATSRSVASVKYQELSDSEVKSNFIETLVSVEGAAGFAPINYRVFTYVPVEPFSIVNHYKIFI